MYTVVFAIMKANVTIYRRIRLLLVKQFYLMGTETYVCMRN